jgi:hypothetical protein
MERLSDKYEFQVLYDEWVKKGSPSPPFFIEGREYNLKELIRYEKGVYDEGKKRDKKGEPPSWYPKRAILREIMRNLEGGIKKITLTEKEGLIYTP